MSKKRCRKSKIVLRECVESDEEIEANLQGNILHRKSNTSTDNNITQTLNTLTQKNETPPIQFSVTIDVEKFDEECNDQFETKEQPFTPETANLGISNRTPHKKGYILNRKRILEAVKKIMDESNNDADQSLCIAVKNCLGHFTKIHLDSFETKIHQVLVKWMDWHKTNNGKVTPLMYKCYICKRAWWHLSEFHDHLKVHDTNKELFGLSLEAYTVCESNIIAYNGDAPKFQYIHPEGNCPKCGDISKTHMISFRTNSCYLCEYPGCSLSFPTCLALKSHETSQHTTETSGNTINAVKWKKSCIVCHIPFYTQASYDKHMEITHTVRSDCVVPMIYKKCQFCNRQYLFNYMQHMCIKKGVVHKCGSCFRRFPPGYLYKTHMSRTESFTCKICNVTLPKECMGVEHLMSHTDKFIIVYKCILCKSFKVFIDEDGWCNHDDEEYDIDSCYKDPIVLPKSCLSKELRESLEIENIINTGIDNRKDEKMDYNPDICVKVEPEEPILDTIIKEENETDHESHTDNDFSKMVIKEEKIDDEYEIDIEENVIPNIFGVKIEAQEIKMENEEESDYEDDIIILNPELLKQNKDENEDIKDENGEMGDEIGEMGDEIGEMEDGIEEEDDIEEYVPRKTKTNPLKLPKLYSCHKCGYEGFHRNYKQHLKLNCLEVDAPGSYSCTKCFSTFGTFKKYILHFTKHNLMPMACPVCFKTLMDIENFKTHVFVHVRMSYSSKQIPDPKRITKFRYKCKVCMMDIDKCDLFVHWETHLKIIDQKADEISEAVTKILQCLQSSEYTTKNKPGCLICHRHFQRLNDCKRHLIEHLLADAVLKQTCGNGLKCYLCDARFLKAHEFKQHMRDHAGLHDYKCNLCHKRFSDSSNYAKHKKVHNLNAYTCDICRRKFNAKSSIEKHMALHEILKPIPCEHCGKIFHIPSMYNKHLRLYHSKKIGQFGCPYCKKRFNSIKLKWEHMWDVHKERKCQADCSLCPMKFRRQIDLRNHLRNDHGMTRHKKQKDLKLKERLDEMLSTPKIVNIASVRETLVVFE